MNKPEEHRDDELLLRLADGELEAKEADQAQAHLKACWRCRTRFEDLQSSIADYMRYRESAALGRLARPAAESGRRACASAALENPTHLAGMAGNRRGGLADCRGCESILA